LSFNESTEQSEPASTQTRVERAAIIPHNQEEGVNSLNEKHIQQVLEIEKQAHTAYEQAVSEAKQIPVQAEQEAQLAVEKARAEAEEEARRRVEGANSEEESNRLLAQAEEKVRRAEAIANSNFDRAVTFALCRLAGKE
jgi:hypothetical protein